MRYLISKRLKRKKRKRTEIVKFVDTEISSSSWRSNFYCLNWTLSLACQALYTFILSGGKRFPFRCRMARGLSPFVKLNRTYFNAYSMTFTDIPVHRYIGSADAEFFRRVYWPPDGYTFLFSNFLPFVLKIWIYGQKNPPN